MESSGSMDLPTLQLVDVVASGQFPLEFQNFSLKCGVLVATDMVLVLGTVVNTLKAQVVDHTTLKLLTPPQVVNIRSVLLVFIHVVLSIVLDAKDVPPTLTVTT